MEDLPDHVNRHRPLRPDELPRHYRRIRSADTDDLVREREFYPEDYRECDYDFWDPWIGQYPRQFDDEFPRQTILQRIAWDLVFEKGAPVAHAVPPETWARMEALVAGRPAAETPPQKRKPRPGDLAARLKERLSFVNDESTNDCVSLLRSELRLVNTGQLDELISLCISQHPEEVETFKGAVLLMMILKPFWVGDLSSWKMPMGNATEALHSLLAHLFAEYPVPPFLYRAWSISGRWSPLAKWVAWFVLLGRGASLHRVSHVFGWRIHEKLVVHLLGAPRNLTPFEACAWAEVHRLGGSPAEFRRIRAIPAFAIDVTEPFGDWDGAFGDITIWFTDGRAFSDRFLKFWRETIPWLVRHRDRLNDDDSAAILAWAAESARGAPFSWRGRTPRGCLRQVEIERRRWEKPYRNIRWASKGWNWDWSPGGEEHWSIRELTTGKALFEEGARMRHCVNLYAASCYAAQSSIFSLTYCGEPRLTIEVSPLQREIAQARGANNRPPTAEESAILERWHAEVLRARKTPQR